MLTTALSLSLSLFLTLTGCGEKKPANTAASSASAGVTDETKIPDDDMSRAFANRLIGNPIRDFKPTDNSDALFIYKTMTFKANNAWNAQGELTAQGEKVECVERGTWKMDGASANDTATMEWAVDYTNCPGRPANNIMRVKVNISQSGVYTIQFR
jgi:hypothetical protein